jgi:septum site-determining protein MinD
VNTELLKKKEIISPEEIQEILDIPLLGVIPEDYFVVISANQGKPFAYQTQSKLGELFLHIAKQLSSEEPVMIEDSIKAESLWNKVKKSFTLKK